MPYRNAHLSFSRITRFESCPLSFKLHYIDRRGAEPTETLQFGKTIHWVLEHLLAEALADERTGPLVEDRALELLRQAWPASGLSGIDLFSEALTILRDFVRRQGVVDHRDVLAVEKEFRLEVGGFHVLGYIDRVDQISADTIEILDYKTNRQLYSREDLQSSLQLSLYQVAAQRIWPWAKQVKLSFEMLRHGVRQSTSRTPRELADALAYIETLGRQSEEATEYPPRLNANCCYCDHRSQCPAYAEALAGKRSTVCADLSNLEAVGAEREEVARLAKILYARKEELERILKAHLKNQSELALGGMRYKMFKAKSVEYPLEPTIALLAKVSGLTREQLLATLGAVDNKALAKTLETLAERLPPQDYLLLKAELQCTATTHFTPRFWAAADKRPAAEAEGSSMSSSSEVA